MRIEKKKKSKNFIDRTDGIDRVIDDYYAQAMDKWQPLQPGNSWFNRTPITPPAEFKQAIRNATLMKIMNERALVDPRVVLDAHYGDLIPTDKRLEDFINSRKNKKTR